jgi:hypothetical protein
MLDGKLPLYPNSIPISLGLQERIKNIILEHKVGISSLAFANLYLFRKKYNFRISLLENSLLIIGEEKEKTFFSILGKIPQKETLMELLKEFNYWKNIPEEYAIQLNTLLPSEIISEDRNNFEYLYLRTDLAELPGKNFQKKRNLVNSYVKNYTQEEREIKVLDKNTLKDALQVLDEWKQNKGEHGDYDSAKEGVELHEVLNFSGLIFYVKGIPVAYCQGEILADGKSFAVHFEKALDKYKGIYQYINQEFAKTIPENIVYINREQDLGDEGLRQAKMTYRPVDFVKLFKVLNVKKSWK